MSQKHLVTGAAGMIGSHLVRRLVQQGEEVVGVDNLLAGSLKNVEDVKEDFRMVIADCRDFRTCMEWAKGKDYVWTFASNMGGIKFITGVHAPVIYDNAMINLNILKACQIAEVSKVFYSSSACVYSELYQKDADAIPLKEEFAYPSMPNEPYGWEKLFTEQVCASFIRDYHMNIRIARFHNIFGGAMNAYDKDRGKAPAHMIRKAIQHPNPPFVVWGDGKQTRSFCYIDDCIDGILRLMESDYNKPINIGSDRLINMDELANMAIALVGKKIELLHDLTKPQGVRGRNSDNTLVKAVLNWSPKISLEEGMRITYEFAVEHYDELEGI